MRIPVKMIEKLGFTVCAIALACANLAMFIIIILTGIYQVWEPNLLLLGIETALASLFIIWGMVRLVRDVRSIG